jgi:hypothetical protein
MAYQVNDPKNIKTMKYVKHCGMNKLQENPKSMIYDRQYKKTTFSSNILLKKQITMLNQSIESDG